jgi:hypothetical protein
MRVLEKKSQRRFKSKFSQHLLVTYCVCIIFDRPIITLKNSMERHRRQKKSNI